MTGPVAPRFLTTTKPPPSEKLAKLYFSPLMAPTPVATRLPRPAETADTINGFLRIEAGGGVLRPVSGLEQLMWDVSVILHAYAPNTEESFAEELIGRAVAWGANAQGTTTTLRNGDKWYVAYSNATGLATRKADPLVNMTRYRAMVTWRIPGLPITPGEGIVRHTPEPGDSAALGDSAAAPARRRTPPPPGTPRPSRRR